MFHSENCSLNRDHTEMTAVEPTWNSQAEGDKDCLFSNGAENIYQRSLFPIIKEIASIYQMKCSKSRENRTTFVSTCTKSLIIIRTIVFVLFGTGRGRSQ